MRISRSKTIGHQKENHHAVETFTQAFENNLLKKEKNVKQIPHKNVSKKEEDALHNLSKKDDIIITKADKGGTIVIFDTDDYVQEANQQLDNKEFYKKLTIDISEINRIKVNRTINELKSSHLLDKMTYLVQRQKHHDSKCFQRFTKRGILAHQWSVQSIVILQTFQNTLITISYILM